MKLYYRLSHQIEDSEGQILFIFSAILKTVCSSHDSVCVCLCDHPVLHALCRGLIFVWNLKLKQDLEILFFL